MRNRNVWALIAVVAFASACSGIARREDPQTKLDRFMDYAGPSIESFSHLGRYDSWQVLTDDKLVIFPSFNEAYLLTVGRPCSGLRFANRIGLTSTGSTVSRRFDFVRFGQERCQIIDIRKVDYRQMKADMRSPE
jgi:hypothetical protein